VRLRHANTHGYLHSHLHQSPLSRQQEVSCYDGRDSGDNWKVECLNTNDKIWLRESTVQFVHEDTNAYLSSFANHQFGQPIPGQLEVAASKYASKNSQWMAQVIFKSDLLYSQTNTDCLKNDTGRCLFCFIFKIIKDLEIKKKNKGKEFA
jgi:dolichyl-phosphate-mannose--protein O-mannosyl transferase